MKTKCSVCGLESRKNGGIYNHILLYENRDLEHKQLANDLLRCSICNQVYPTTQGLSAHKRSQVCTNNKQGVTVNPSATWLLGSISSGNSPLSLEQKICHLYKVLPHAGRLLQFMCTFDAQSIPEILFRRLLDTREHWGPNGDIEHMTYPVDLGFDKEQFGKYIKHLESLEFVKLRQDRPLGMREFSIELAIRQCVIKTDQDRWICLVVVCYAFPGTREETGFGDLGIVLLPLLQYALACSKDYIKAKIYEYPTTGYGIVLTILLSSYVGDKAWKLEAITLAGSLLPCLESGDGTLYLEMLRKERNRDLAQRPPNTSIESLCGVELAKDPRTNACYGKHLESNTQDLIMTNYNLEQALKESLKYKFYRTIPSEMEKREEYCHSFLRGKIYRWSAQFLQAYEILHKLQESRYFPKDEAGYNIVNHYVGVLCEQRQVVEAEKIARQTIIPYENPGQLGLMRNRLISFRVLQLVLAETLICRALIQGADALPCTRDIQEKLDEAGKILSLLKEEFKRCRLQRVLSRGSEMNYLRVCMGRALTSYLSGCWEESYQRWEEVRQQAIVCNDVVTDFVLMITDYSMCYIWLQRGNPEQAAPFLHKARDKFERIGREHWWTGLGTFLLDIFMATIPGSGICVMSCSPKWEIGSKK